MQPLEESETDEAEFVSTLGALFRSAERSGVDVTRVQTVESVEAGRSWTVEVAPADDRGTSDGTTRHCPED